MIVNRCLPWTCILAVGLAWAGGTWPVAADGRWNTVEIEGRDYLRVSDLARKFGMTRGEGREDPAEIAFRSEAYSLIVKAGSRQALIDGVRHWLSFPVLREEEGEGAVYLSLLDVNATVIPALEPRFVDSLSRVDTIVFDPGHGGADPGGRGYLGCERDYTLDVVKRTRRILEGRGVKVVQNRLSDFFIPLSQRPSMTKNYENPIFVSVHFNASPNRKARGFEIFALPPTGAPSQGSLSDPERDAEEYPNSAHEPASFVLANTMYQTLLGKMSGFDRGVKRARFSVLRHATVPAVLVEGGFLTNWGDARRIHDPAWRERLAAALADGIVAYVELANEKTVPKRAIDLNRKPTREFVEE